MEVENLEERLRRREATLGRYVAVRGWVGAVLIPLGAALAIFGLLVLIGQAPDVSFVPEWSHTTLGRYVVTGISWVLAAITLRAGIAFWKARTPDKDTGCLLG